MRANIRAHIALNAVFRKPSRNVNGNSAFFKRGGTCGECTVFTTGKYGNGKLIALSSRSRNKNGVDKINKFFVVALCLRNRN